MARVNESPVGPEDEDDGELSAKLSLIILRRSLAAFRVSFRKLSRWMNFSRTESVTTASLQTTKFSAEKRAFKYAGVTAGS
jgi:hypothetical protein